MKILRSKKALSPVVASIILIAVTVAVSIAVAAWMGALTIGFMGGSEQVEIRTISFTGNTTATLKIKNTGTSPVTIQEVWINNVEITTGLDPDVPFAISANEEETLTITGASGTFVAGDNYQFKVVTAKANPFMKNASPPST